MNLFIYKNNCKSSKQVLDILELRRENNIKMICIDNLPKHKAVLITEKYKVRDTPCIITSSKILYSSEMFSFIKNGTDQKPEEKKDGFFTGFNILDSGSGVFSQSFCAINDEEVDAQQYFYNVEGISGPPVEAEKNNSQKNKKSKSKKASEVDRKYEELMDARNNENKKQDKRYHNDVPDFSKPFNKI